MYWLDGLLFTLVIASNRLPNLKKITQLGSNWNNGMTAGSFNWNLNNSVGNRNRNISSHLVKCRNQSKDCFQINV
jgi:hypothetical protein